MVYLDNAATTEPKFFGKDYSQYWMNSNTPYAYKEQIKLNEARERIKDALGVKTGKIIFCRSATEAVEWLCRNVRKSQFNILACSPYEHDSVTDAIAKCNCNYEVVRPENISNLTVLYIHQDTNQLTGFTFALDKIYETVKEQSPDCYFGIDMTAAIGHSGNWAKLEKMCDAVWFSGHKFHTEKGIGAIWISDKLFRHMLGDADSKNNYDLLHGTLNVPSCISLSYAFEEAMGRLNESMKHYNKLFIEMQKRLKENGIDYTIKRFNDNYIDGKTNAINAVTLNGINADVLQQYLTSKKIYIGVGHSACAADADYGILSEFEYTEKEATETVRISFNRDNTIQDIEDFVKAIKEFKERFC